MTPIQQDFKSIRIYKTIDPLLIVKNARLLAKLLFGMNTLNEEGKTFTVSPASGFIYYCDSNSIWKNTSEEDLPKNSNEIEKMVRSFIEKSNKKISFDSRLKKDKIISIFPLDIKYVASGWIIDYKTNKKDHCLANFAVYLASGTNEKIPVDGAMIEARIGKQGKILSFYSKWRPIVSESLSKKVESKNSSVTFPIIDILPALEIPPILKPNILVIEEIATSSVEISKNPGEEEKTAEDVPALIFKMEDGYSAQTYYTPYYIKGIEDDSTLENASEHSMIINITEFKDNKVTKLVASITGGSGQFQYFWTSWQTNSLMTEGVSNIGNAREILVGKGVYNVILQVIDIVTKIKLQTEKTVYSFIK